MFRKKTGAEVAEDKAAIARMLAIYKAVFGLPALLAILCAVAAIAYGKGYFDGALARPTIFERNPK